MKLKNTITAGLAALTLGACNFPDYTGAGTYSCEKYQKRIAAKHLTREAVKESYQRINRIEYTTNMGAEEAIKAIDACEKAFKLKAEKEQ